MSDTDDAEWTDADFARARPAATVHGKTLAGRLVRQGRPPSPATERKQQVTLRLSPKVIDHFKRGGPGWQTRINEVLEREAAARR